MRRHSLPLVDGRWENDPTAPLIDDGDGHMNNRLRVPYPARLAVVAESTPGAIEIAGATVRPDYSAMRPEMRAALTRDQFRTYATVQVPVTCRGRAAYGVHVTLGTSDRVIATVALDAHHNGVATFAEVPADVPLQIRLARAQESVPFADRRVEEPDGVISGVAPPRAAGCFQRQRNRCGWQRAGGSRTRPVTLAAGRRALERTPPIGVYGVYAGYTFPLAPDRTEIGREISRGVALPQDGNVSRRHAVIQYLDGEYVLRDEGSSNGTYVDGVRIPVDVPHPIKPGDEIQFGASRFRFET